MPAAPPTTLIHYSRDAQTGGRAACGTIAPTDGELAGITARFGMVTCFGCRRTHLFLRDQKAAEMEGVGAPTPLRQVIAESEDMQALARQVLKTWKNERGMYVIEEAIHHGDYRSTRRVEVYDITPVTVDAVLISSAYCYGSWLDPHGPYPDARRPKLFELVEDLRAGRENRQIGWSTFKLVK